MRVKISRVFTVIMKKHCSYHLPKIITTIEFGKLLPWAFISKVEHGSKLNTLFRCVGSRTSVRFTKAEHFKNSLKHGICNVMKLIQNVSLQFIFLTRDLPRAVLSPGV